MRRKIVADVTLSVMLSDEKPKIKRKLSLIKITFYEYRANRDKCKLDDQQICIT